MRDVHAMSRETLKTGRGIMLTLESISPEQKSVLQALVSMATRPDQTGRNVWSNSDGYQLGIWSVIELNLRPPAAFLLMILRQESARSCD